LLTILKTGVRTADLALLACAATLLLNVKPGFVVTVLLVFMLSLRQFSSVRQYAVWIGVILVCSLGLSALIILLAPDAAPGYVASLGSRGSIRAANWRS